jgi:ABC-2 type transport system permease protein
MTTSTYLPSPPRALPRCGGFSATFLGLELRRLLRNRRAMVLTLIMPTAFFAIFGLQDSARSRGYGSGNVTGYIMVSMAVYGALLATTSGGAMVSLERAQGWSRQLRLTPLHPAAYIATKIGVAMAAGLVSVTSVFVVGTLTGAHVSPPVWVSCFVLAWVSSLVFAAFGLFMGYLLPSDNVMQVLGPVLAIMSFAGGLFYPLSGWWSKVAMVFPTYGVAGLVRAPFGAESAGTIALALVNLVSWATVFSLGAMALFRRDTARV